MKTLVDVAVDPMIVDVVEALQGLTQQVRELPDACAVERLVHEGLKSIERAYMEQCVRLKVEQVIEEDVREVRCPHCDGWAVVRQTRAARWALTVRGRIDFERPVYRCEGRDCQRERCLVDEQLGLEPKEHFTPLVQSKVAWAATSSASFERAGKDLTRLAELEVSPKQVHRIFEKIGGRALALQDAEVSRDGAPASPQAPIATEEQPETVVLEMDGTCVMGRDGEGHEVKCATVFGLDARAVTGSPGKERPVLLSRAYCATSRGIRAFSGMTWALANRWGVRSARRVVVIGDGIDWIWNWSADRLHRTTPEGTEERPVEIVDFWHACENLSDAREAIFADPAGAAARKWQDTWRHRLRAGGIDALVAELERRSKAAGDQTRRDRLRVRTQYFRKHRERMRYKDFEAQGLPIGSGAIEGTCKNLVKGRMAGVGMRWDAEEGIEPMCALRVRMFNERWEDLWPNSQNPDAKAA